jgi:hypothetical protein
MCPIAVLTVFHGETAPKAAMTHHCPYSRAQIAECVPISEPQFREKPSSEQATSIFQGFDMKALAHPVATISKRGVRRQLQCRDIVPSISGLMRQAITALKKGEAA